MGFKLLFIVFIYVLFSSCIYANNKLNVDFKWWFGDLETKVLNQSNGNGNFFDFKNSFNFEKRDIKNLSAIWEVGRFNKVGLSYYSSSNSNLTTLKNDIIFGGKKFTSNSEVLGKLNYDYGEFSWNWWFYQNKRFNYKIGTLFQIKGTVIKTLLDAQKSLGSSYYVEDSYSSILPCIGYSTKWSPSDLVTMFSNTSGIRSGKYGYYFDSDNGVRLHLTPAFSLQAGYRILKIYVKDSINYSRIYLDGAYIGAIFTFF